MTREEKFKEAMLMRKEEKVQEEEKRNFSGG